MSEFLAFRLFHDTLVHFSSLTETWLERHKSFVFRLSRTAVLYVIYHGVGGGRRDNGKCQPKIAFFPPPPPFLRISRVTHSCILLVCHWPSSRRLVSHHRICRPRRSLAPVRNVKCVRSPDLQHLGRYFEKTPLCLSPPSFRLSQQHATNTLAFLLHDANHSLHCSARP